ncbi:MAG TPA: cytochrome c [Burkholderiaceae bacterium]|nr:cytochrome c [Burkholderiaceae bacterium]
MNVRAAWLLPLGVLAALGAVAWLNLRGDAHFAGDASSVPVTPQLVARGAALARAGDCAGCHTDRGGAPFAGGRGIATPFGTVFAGNLTPDVATGIGAWSAGDFWRALHNGRSKDGRLLYPAFPYTSTSQVTREDADAIFAFLRTLPAVRQANRAHEMRFPYDNQVALALWRALYFRPAVFVPQADRSAEWNRGAYLVRGLGHCEACHAARNALGATDDPVELGGGLIPVQNWYAPSLASAREAGVAHWTTDEVVALLKTGTTARGSVQGPMAEVVFRSTQHLDDTDLRAIAVFLQALPASEPPAPAPKPIDPGVTARGADLYQQHCADCHGAEGQGARGAVPPLAGNRRLTMTSATNVVRMIVEGGFPPATAGHPRPYGMPPFGHILTRSEIAAVATYVRNAWGQHAPAVSELDVLAFK